ncbi:MAG TPA: hypothetical protein VMU22_09155 [Rhizomicrobium sp.]|nr:hypothetical protein [Rhizomicrobium sp.]
MADSNRGADGLRPEINFKDVLKQIWLGRSLIGFSIVVLLIIACADILLVRPTYQATMMVAPVKALDQINSPEPILNASKLLGTVDDVTRFQIYLKRYTSVDIAVALERDHHLLRRVYAHRWDAKDQRWLPSHSVGTFLRRLFGVPTSDAPTVFDLRDFLTRNVEVSPGTGEELQTITFADEDPAFARDLLTWMHQEGENLAKLQGSGEAKRNIAYLESTLATVNETEQRRVLIDLLAKQENQLMLSQGGGDYAAQVIEAPSVPVLPFSPNPPLLLGLAIIGGLALGIFGNVLILLFDKGAKPKKIVVLPPRFSGAVGANVKGVLRSFSRA